MEGRADLLGAGDRPIHLLRGGQPADQVRRLMRGLQLCGVRRGKVKRTTLPGDVGERPQDLVERTFTASAPNRPVGRQKSMWSQAARSYTGCKPLRIGRETTLPAGWRGLGAGVSRLIDRWG